jgi:hypothetical protein
VTKGLECDWAQVWSVTECGDGCCRSDQRETALQCRTLHNSLFQEAVINCQGPLDVPMRTLRHLLPRGVLHTRTLLHNRRSGHPVLDRLLNGAERLPSSGLGTKCRRQPTCSSCCFSVAFPCPAMYSSQCWDAPSSTWHSHRFVVYARRIPTYPKRRRAALRRGGCGHLSVATSCGFASKLIERSFT